MPNVLINEISPGNNPSETGTSTDPNGDGIAEWNDEFVEIVNNSGGAVDLGGWMVASLNGSSLDEVRHTFADPTVLADGAALVLFQGGDPMGDFGFATVVLADSILFLDTPEDTIKLVAGTTEVDAVSYSSTTAGESLTRDPDVTGPDTFVVHSVATGSGGAPFSPGTGVDSVQFPGAPLKLGLTLDPDSVLEGQLATGTVTRFTGQGLGSPLVVNLLSSDTTEATVGATVTILASEESADFTITAVADSESDGNQMSTISVSAADFTGAQADLAVGDADSPQITLSFNKSSVAEDAGATAVTATVSVLAMPGALLTITLTSTDTDNSEITLPASVDIASDGTEAMFSIGAVDDGVIDGNETITVTAAAAGYLSDDEGLTVTNIQTPDWIINEILADPAPDAPGDANGDANGDGTGITTQDEFVEILNASGVPVDISGWTLSDLVSVRHTFAAGTVVPNLTAVVVFAGGDPMGTFGEAVVRTAGPGGLGLNNTGDTVTLADDQEVPQAVYAYGSEGGDNQSLTRDPDILGLDPLAKHSTANGSGGALYSPGTQIDGSNFPGVGALSLALNPAQVKEDAGAAASTGTVTRTGDLAGDLLVTLSSDDTDEATVPATVTILDDNASADFDIDAVPDGFKDDDTDVKISASAVGQAPAEETLLVENVDLNPGVFLVAVPDVFTEGAGTMASTVTVSVSEAPDSTLTINLTTNGDGTEISIPVSVEIAAQATMVQFDIAALEDGVNDGTQVVAITATATDHVDGSDSVTIVDVDRLIINEVLADPAVGTPGDANGDTTRNGSEDEFVEIVNNSGAPMDISGWGLYNDDTLRHTFADGTVLPHQAAAVVFGGGTPTGGFGNSLVQTATGGFLGITNNGDTVSVRNPGGGTIASLIFENPFGFDIDASWTRDPDITGGEPLVAHYTATGSGESFFSPGTLVNGDPFPGNGAIPSLTLSNSTIAENEAIGTTIGNFIAVNFGGAVAYSFVAGAGDDDNGLFIFDGGFLLTDAILDAEVKTSCQIRVNADDQLGVSLTVSLIITVTDDLFEDADGDGLNETEEGVAGTSDTNADTDGDGVGDGDEVNQWGTDPLDPNSTARAEKPTFDGNDITITWSSVIGVTYRLQQNTSLDDPQGWVDVDGTETIANANTSSVTVTIPGGDERFYRVRTVILK